MTPFQNQVLTMWDEYAKKHPGKNPHGEFKDLLIEAQLSMLEDEAMIGVSKENEIRMLDRQMEACDDEVALLKKCLKAADEMQTTIEIRQGIITCIGNRIVELRQEAQRLYERSCAIAKEVCNG